MKTIEFNGARYKVEQEFSLEKTRKLLPTCTAHLWVRNEKSGVPYTFMEFEDGKRRITSMGRGMPRTIYEDPKYRKPKPTREPDLMERFIEWITT